MIANTKHKKESSWDDFSWSIQFELESGKVTGVHHLEYSAYGHTPKFKFNSDGMLIEIYTTIEKMYLSKERLKELSDLAVEKIATFKKEHIHDDVVSV